MENNGIDSANLLSLGLPGEIIDVATREELLDKYKLNPKGIAEKINLFTQNNSNL